MTIDYINNDGRYSYYCYFLAPAIGRYRQSQHSTSGPLLQHKLYASLIYTNLFVISFVNVTSKIT